MRYDWSPQMAQIKLTDSEAQNLSLEDALTELELAGLEAEELTTRPGTWRILDTEGKRVGWMTVR